jgi:hypothetical protein
MKAAASSHRAGRRRPRIGQDGGILDYMVLPLGRAAASSWPLADRVLAFSRTAGWGTGRRRGCRFSSRAPAVGEKTRAISFSGMED